MKRIKWIQRDFTPAASNCNSSLRVLQVQGIQNTLDHAYVEAMPTVPIKFSLQEYFKELGNAFAKEDVSSSTIKVFLMKIFM